jgi:phosphotriesterase-related protein
LTVPVIETAAGQADVSALGPTLMHEHIVNINAEVARDQPEMSWGEGREAVRKLVIAALDELAGCGIRTIVDATVFGHGRDIEFVQEISRQVDVNIVVATGIYSFNHLPPYFSRRTPTPSRPRDALTEFFVRDITRGIAGTGVKAGIIKAATDVEGVTPLNDRMLRAVAAAHRETGVPITTHTRAPERNGLDQQRVFAEEGVDLTRVVIGHCGDSQDYDYLRAIMDQGSMIGADRFGMHLPGRLTMDERVAIVADLCSLGYSDRIVLSHDYTLYSDWFDESVVFPDEWRMTHISGFVIPALRRRGVPADQIEQMLVGNPGRLFATQGPY